MVHSLLNRRKNTATINSLWNNSGSTLMSVVILTGLISLSLLSIYKSIQISQMALQVSKKNSLATNIAFQFESALKSSQALKQMLGNINNAALLACYTHQSTCNGAPPAPLNPSPFTLVDFTNTVLLSPNTPPSATVIDQNLNVCSLPPSNTNCEWLVSSTFQPHCTGALNPCVADYLTLTVTITHYSQTSSIKGVAPVTLTQKIMVPQNNSNQNSFSQIQTNGCGTNSYPIGLNPDGSFQCTTPTSIVCPTSSILTGFGYDTSNNSLCSNINTGSKYFQDPSFICNPGEAVGTLNPFNCHLPNNVPIYRKCKQWSCNCLGDKNDPPTISSTNLSHSNCTYQDVNTSWSCSPDASWSPLNPFLSNNYQCSCPPGNTPLPLPNGITLDYDAAPLFNTWCTSMCGSVANWQRTNSGPNWAGVWYTDCHCPAGIGATVTVLYGLCDESMSCWSACTPYNWTCTQMFNCSCNHSDGSPDTNVNPQNYTPYLSGTCDNGSTNSTYDCSCVPGQEGND